MTVDELIEIEIIARDLVAELEKEIDEARKHAAPPGKLDGTEGRLSRQDSMIHHEIAKDAMRRRKTRLARLREALERMDRGNFGHCANCGADLEYDRLCLQPETILCSPCARR